MIPSADPTSLQVKYPCIPLIGRLFRYAELACDGVVYIEDAMEKLESVSTWIRFGKKYASYYGPTLRYG